MNNSLDKLIGNDELLAYICLILGIFNTFLMSMVITGIKHNYNIYIFLLFEALFLIFIVYFILKKKDVYSKDDDIKYDWYFYLRISIITLVFFNFALYIYNISNDSSTNSLKNGGGGAFSSLVSSNKVAPAAPADIENKIMLLKNELEPLTGKLTRDLDKLKKGVIGVGSTDKLREEIEEKNAALNKLQGESTVASRVRTRESKAKDTNRVVPVKFPYQNSEPTTNPELTTRDIFRSDLPPKEKISLWGKLEKEKKLKNK